MRADQTLTLSVATDGTCQVAVHSDREHVTLDGTSLAEDEDKKKDESGGKKRSDRRSYLKRTYGISLEDYDAMLDAQDGRCAICHHHFACTQHSRSTSRACAANGLR